MEREVHGETMDLTKRQETQLGGCIQEVTSSLYVATVEIAVEQTQSPACTTNLLEVLVIFLFYLFIYFFFEQNAGG
jgi:hypothetical protein